MLAMLHVLEGGGSRRDVWWLLGGRNRDEPPFREESGRLLRTLVYGDLVPNRTLRVVGFVLVTICIVAAAILATSHGDDT